MMKEKMQKVILRLFTKIFHRKEYMSESQVMTLFHPEDIKNSIERIKEKKVRTVAFFCMSLPMWKYDTLYRALREHPLFHPLIFIAPRNADWPERKASIKAMTDYFQANKYEYIPLKSDFFNYGQKLNKYAIDIAFFTQPYTNVICKEYNYDKLCGSLLCYVPYGYYLAHQEFCYNSLLNKIAWSNFYPAVCHIAEARSFNQEEQNIVISGYPGYDMYNECLPLKWCQEGKKKIIWAPHFSVSAKGWMHLSSFMQISSFMIELAQKFHDKIQIAFKPHPNLYDSLCKEWGEEKTRRYYNAWAEGNNTMLCLADNYPLFKSSDAMIHDCGSFLMEYLYTQKPCLYLYLNEQNNFNLNEAGKAAMDAHYQAKTKEDIEKFILEVVLGGEDDKAAQRRSVADKYIIPVNHKTATEDIISKLTTL